MSFEHRQQALGLVLGLVAFVAYWAVIVVRAAGDGVPFTEVEWQTPMLVAIVVGGILYAAVYGAMRFRARGTRVTDERDQEIARYAESAGASLTGITVLTALILLTRDVDPFWVAHVLFVGSYLASLVTGGVSLAAYREGSL